MGARSQIVINEIMAAASERLLQWSEEGVPRLGTGLAWYEEGFEDAQWQTGLAPFGFGSLSNASPPAAIATNLATQMQNVTPTLYLRKSFEVSADDALRTEALQFVVQYNDGFVAYVNGREVCRRNAGPPKQFLYRDQVAYNTVPHAGSASGSSETILETIALGSAADILKPGTNVLAVQVLNASLTSSNLFLKPQLQIAGASTIMLIPANDSWRYFPGLVEPSGGLFDPALLTSGMLSVPWGRTTFDDTEWGTANGPILVNAAGINGNGAAVIGQATSMYIRRVFQATASEAAESLPLLLLVDHDDAFVAYINGVEVARANVGSVVDGTLLPHTFTPYFAVANGTRNYGSTITYTIAPPNKLLVPGANVLAIQFHNVSRSDSDMYLRADLRTNSAGSNRVLVANNGQWRFFPGFTEPIPEEDVSIEDSPEAPDSATDWVELHNRGTAPVSLANWSLTDDPSDPRRWIFPEVSIPAGGFLVVICDGRNLRANPGGYLHTNFKLAKGGEYLALFDGNGQPVSRFTAGYGPQSPFHSFARQPDGTYAYSEVPTPGAANAGPTLAGFVALPTFSVAGGFYATSQSISLATSTAGAIIRYTVDGSEPSLSRGLTATGPISVTSSRSIRAKAFKDGWIPSETATSTYVLQSGLSSAAWNTRRSLPAIMITGDPERSLYRPFGLMSIVGGGYGADSTWTSLGDRAAYNTPFLRGRSMERPATWEFFEAGGAPGFKLDFGLRISGSNHARPRYKLTNQNSATPNSASPWTSSSSEKPSFNLYFRSDFGGDPLSYPLFPDSPVTKFHDLRLRAGKNDISNPFIQDELMRRLFADTGQVGSVGILNTLFINGIYKGYYNLAQHLREDFFQRAYQSKLGWDVRQVADVPSGDAISFQEIITFIRTNPQTSLANFQAMQTRLDMVNFIDYLLVNTLGANQDWPHNNWVSSHERSATGLHRFHVWDAEGSFGSFGNSNIRMNSFDGTPTGGTAILTSNPSGESLSSSIKVLYTLLKPSAEFRMLFADRIQAHFFQGGALTEARVLARWNALKSQIQPFISNFNDRVTPWMNGVGDPTRYTTGAVTNSPSRRNVLFQGYVDDSRGGVAVPGHFVSEGLWPSVTAPVFSAAGGTVAPGAEITITNPNGSGTIYYALNGIDPRAAGGAVQGMPYTAPLAMSQTTILKARVRSASGVWSPLAEARFTVAQAVPLRITEIMYHPADQGGIDGDEFEFLELKNVGTFPIHLYGMKFTAGITFAFPPGAVLAPGAFAVLVKNATQFAAKYPGVPIAGVYGPATSLSNSGETVTLSDLAGAVVDSVTYSDVSPWPVSADGMGNSLVPVDVASPASPNDPAYWRASSLLGGSPGADDPVSALPQLVINEVLAAPGPGQEPAVEIANLSATAGEFGGWYLSDKPNTPKKVRIPEGWVVPASGFLVLPRSLLSTSATPVALSPAGGRLRLSSADAAGNLTGYSHTVTYGASEPGVSSGRHLISTGAETFPLQASPTLGMQNAGPRIGPVIITEMSYHPPAGHHEYVEIRNISADAIPLFTADQPSAAWRISGLGSTAPEWTLPAGLVLAPREFLLVTQIDPPTFRAQYGIPASVQVFQYPGALSNSGELVALEKPLLASPGAYVTIDGLTYQDVSPWPTAADGLGSSLERRSWRAFADDPANWRASAAVNGTPGRLGLATYNEWAASRFSPAELGNPAFSGPDADPDGDGLSNRWEYAHGLDPLSADGALAWEVTLEPGQQGDHLTLRYRRNPAAEGIAFHGDTAAQLGGAWQLDGAPEAAPAVRNADGTETITRRDPVSTEESARRFIRLRLTP